MSEFKTSDIVLAATLKCFGYELLKIEKAGQKGTFCFENVSEEIINEFDTGKCLIEPISFNNTIKALTTSVRRHLT
jgi:hypothetical protein